LTAVVGVVCRQTVSGWASSDGKWQTDVVRVVGNKSASIQALCFGFAMADIQLIYKTKELVEASRVIAVHKFSTSDHSLVTLTLYFDTTRRHR